MNEDETQIQVYTLPSQGHYMRRLRSGGSFRETGALQGDKIKIRVGVFSITVHK